MLSFVKRFYVNISKNVGFATYLDKYLILKGLRDYDFLNKPDTFLTIFLTVLSAKYVLFLWSSSFESFARFEAIPSFTRSVDSLGTLEDVDTFFIAILVEIESLGSSTIVSMLIGRIVSSLGLSDIALLYVSKFEIRFNNLSLSLGEKVNKLFIFINRWYSWSRVEGLDKSEELEGI